MLCKLILTIVVLGQTYTVAKEYSGAIISVNETTYTVDFSTHSDWLKTLDVPKQDCVKD